MIATTLRAIAPAAKTVGMATLNGAVIGGAIAGFIGGLVVGANLVGYACNGMLYLLHSKPAPSTPTPV